MDKNQIQSIYKEFRSYIFQKRLIEAFSKLKIIIESIGDQYFNIQFDKHKETYRNILNYSLLAPNDPEKARIIGKVFKDVLELGDKAKEKALAKFSGMKCYQTKWQLENNGKDEYLGALAEIEEFGIAADISDVLKDIYIDTSNNKKADIKTETLNSLFEFFWLSDDLNKQQISLLHTINESTVLPIHVKCITVSALSLSLFRCFDFEKLNILKDFYRKQENQVWQRAFIGILLSVYIYNSRLYLYPEFKKFVDDLSDDQNSAKHLKDVYIQLLRAKETEAISKQWEEEIMPEVMKMRPKLEDKLDLENIISEKFIEDENPDWGSFFEESPGLLDKLAHFSQMQMEGSDVFMGTFARLKSYPFFNHISNWFTPFYKEHQEIASIFTKKEDGTDMTPFIANLEHSFFMCNSDKYSFCLNIQYMPESQKSMMMNLYEQELKNMNEVSGEDQMLQPEIKDQNIYAQYIQDLYRFFKVHPDRKEFRDVFKFKLDIHNSKIYQQLADDQVFLRSIAEYHFKKNHFDEAIEVFDLLLEFKPNSAEIIEKIGFSYQKQKNYELALEYFLKAELLETNKLWLIKKLAFCYRKLENSEKALEYYLMAEKSKPEDVYILANIGHTYLQIKDYENALKYYFKVEFLSPENEKIQRPIAWCSFVLGKFDAATRYLDKLLKKEQNRYDLMNKAHVEWCTGNIAQAINYYKKCLNANNNDLSSFSKAYDSDRQFLENHGILPIDIDLMLDAVKT